MSVVPQALLVKATAVVSMALGGAVLPVVATPAVGMPVPPTGSVVATVRGNGHGHGMSQYGAEGAALQGLGYRQIVAFYYPGTRLITTAPSRIQVKIGGTRAVAAVAAANDLTVTGIAGALPANGISQYRLEPGAGTGLVLQSRATGANATWKFFRASLPSGAQFHRTGWEPVRLFASNGTSTAYYGFVRALRNAHGGTAGGVTIVDDVSLENYTAGVVPREMPSSWSAQAVDAQAVAARTYGEYEAMNSAGNGYDICDNSNCQVYGGAASYASNGSVLWTDDQPAAHATARQVLTYRGSVIFAQFAASDGGWTVDGGQPYLTAHADPYDGAASGDPYLGYTASMTAASLGRQFGLKTLTAINITKRDGHGVWGGRVLSAQLLGISTAGRAATVTVTGSDLQWAFGLGSTWFTLAAHR